MKITEKEIKNPDALVKSGSNLMAWIEKHVGLALVAGGVLLVVGIGYSFLSWQGKKSELVAQEAYFKTEKTFIQKREGFEKAVMQAAVPVDPKADKKNETPKEQGPTMDLEKDYGTVVKEFTEVIAAHPKTKAAGMAALSLSSIYSDYGKTEEAVQLLQSTRSHLKSKTLIGALVAQELGVALANKGDCKAAITEWDSLLKENHEFLKNEVKLKLGVCHQQLGDLKKAEDIFKEIQSSEDNSGKAAKKYLRAMQMGAN